MSLDCQTLDLVCLGNVHSSMVSGITRLYMLESGLPDLACDLLESSMVSVIARL